MLKGKFGQGIAVVLVVAFIAAIVGGVIGYIVKPAEVAPGVISTVTTTAPGVISTVTTTAPGVISTVTTTAPGVTTTITPPKMGENLKFVLLCESSASDPGWSYLTQVMIRYADAFGVNFTYRFAEGDYAKHNDMIAEETARGVDAIIIDMWDDTLYNTNITAAVRAGVTVIASGGYTNAPFLPADVVSKINAVLWNFYDFGKALAEFSMEYIPDGATILWPAEVPSGTYITEAIRGWNDYYASVGRTCTINVLDCTSDTTMEVSRIVAYVTAHPDIDAIVTSGALCVDASNQAAVELGLEPGDIPIIGQVSSPACGRGLDSGMMPVAGMIDWDSTSFFDIALPYWTCTQHVSVQFNLPIVKLTQANYRDLVPPGFLG